MMDAPLERNPLIKKRYGNREARSCAPPRPVPSAADRYLSPRRHDAVFNFDRTGACAHNIYQQAVPV